MALAPAGLVAVALGSVLIGVGTLLVVAGFIISTVNKARPVAPGPQQQTNVFDFLVEVAKRIELIYLPGFAMITLGVVLIIAVVAGFDPFTAAGGPTPSPQPS